MQEGKYNPVEKVKIELDEELLFDMAVKRYEYWRGHPEDLKIFIKLLKQEVERLEQNSDSIPEFSLPESSKYKAIWVTSGSGTVKKPVTNAPGDAPNREPGKEWCQGSDKVRVLHAINIIEKISLANSGIKEESSSREEPDIIKEFGPYLIYNGVEEQNLDLLDEVKKSNIKFPIEKIYIPEGEISRTVDQVINLRFPPDLDFATEDRIGVVTHAPHIARVMRMVNRYKTIPKQTVVRAFPIKFPKPENELEFAIGEIMGVLGYVSRDQATLEPYPYIIEG
jgi:hypothetical protein